MEQVQAIIQCICVLGAAMLLGNWYLTEHRKAKAAGKSWYAVYFSLPGILIIGLIFLLPLIIRLR